MAPRRLPWRGKCDQVVQGGLERYPSVHPRLLGTQGTKQHMRRYLVWRIYGLPRQGGCRPPGTHWTPGLRHVGNHGRDALPPAPPNPTTPPSSPGATFCLLEEALESHVFAPFSHRSHFFFLKRVWTHNFRTTLAPEPPFSLSGEALESHFRTTLAPEPLFFK